jgi:hypothetical protein
MSRSQGSVFRTASVPRFERLEERHALATLPAPVPGPVEPSVNAVVVAAEPLEQRFGPLRYVVGDARIAITGIDEATTSVVIPRAIDGLPVTTIGAWAFFGARNLVSVTIPGSVTWIGDSAFRESGITSLTIPRSVRSIGIEACWDCDGLTSLVIPDSVVQVGRNAFEGCSNLRSVSLTASLGTLGHGIFAGCTSLQTVRIPSGITGIAGYAFSGCTTLATVKIPATVTTIGSHAFWNCTALAAVHLPGGVAFLGDGAFAGCTALAAIAIPGSLTKIESDTFSGCTSLAAVSIPGSVREIGALAFYRCSALRQIAIPASVERIGDGPFMDCTSLATIDFRGDPPTIIDFFGDPAPQSDIGPGSPLVVRHRAGNTAWAAFASSGYGGHAVQPVANLPGSALGLKITVGSLPKTVSVNANRAVATVVVANRTGTKLSLAGPDAKSFRLVGTQLVLRSGTRLANRTSGGLAVTVVLANVARPGRVLATIGYRLHVLDVTR